LVTKISGELQKKRICYKLKVEEANVEIGVPKEIIAGETRVALTPVDLKKFLKQNHNVYVETGAGIKASFSDDDYINAGASMVKNTQELFDRSEVILKVQPPAYNKDLNLHEKNLMGDGIIYISFLPLFKDIGMIKDFEKKKITSFAMEFIPRITRAQSMDALSSMATIAGYKAVLMAADRLPKIFPLLMTAAGTIPPAVVLVLGAGVAGLQAIATAKRLGAKVEAFDPRPVVKEQVMSLGAQFVEMETTRDAETEGGYAKMQSEAFLRMEQETIASRLSKTDVIITTAQIFGKPSPLLITEEMVKMMNPGSIIVDIAAEQGGNCELTAAGKTVEKYGVTIIGAVNLPAALPVHASLMYSKNISNLFFHLFQAEDNRLDFNDEITRGACITHNGELVNSFSNKN
jgi:NAD(P) transhydrogenase subunit alpha